MNDGTKNFVIRVVAVGAVLFLLVAGGLYAQALFEGRTVFPQELQTVIITALVLIVGAIGPATAAWISTRASNRNAAQTQAVVTQAVHEAKHEIVDQVNNGGPKKAAQDAATRTIATLATLIVDGDQRKEPTEVNVPETGERRQQPLSDDDIERLR